MSSAYSNMDVPSESSILSISETVSISINLFTKSTLLYRLQNAMDIPRVNYSFREVSNDLYFRYPLPFL